LFRILLLPESRLDQRPCPVPETKRAFVKLFFLCVSRACLGKRPSSSTEWRFPLSYPPLPSASASRNPVLSATIVAPSAPKTTCGRSRCVATSHSSLLHFLFFHASPEPVLPNDRVRPEYVLANDRVSFSRNIATRSCKEDEVCSHTCATSTLDPSANSTVCGHTERLQSKHLIESGYAWQFPCEPCTAPVALHGPPYQRQLVPAPRAKY
jgi:hypothetical protein